MGKKLFNKSDVLAVIFIVIAAIIVGTGLWVFVYQADFAPSGVSGIATIIQYLLKFNAGLVNFALNLPLLVAAWFVLKRKFVIYTIIYVAAESLTILVMDKVGMYQYTGNPLLAAVFGGVCQGMTGVALRVGGSSGGVDIIASMIQKRAQHKNVERIIAVLSYIIVVISFIVYQKIDAALLSIVETFISEKVCTSILKDTRSAVRFEIVTDPARADEIKNMIIFEMKHGATVFRGKGAFSDEDKEVLVCLVNYRQIPEFLKLMKRWPEVFLYYSDVMGVRGNFAFVSGEESRKDIMMRQEKENEMKKEN